MTGDKVRFVTATMLIRANHITAPEQPNAAKLQQAGLSRGEYFRAWLSQLGQRDTEILARQGFKDFAECRLRAGLTWGDWIAVGIAHVIGRTTTRLAREDFV